MEQARRASVSGAEEALNSVIWTARSLANIRAIRGYIAQFNLGAADRLAEKLIAAGDRLEMFPHRGRQVPGTTMREIVAVNP
jgi:plasmid stabilization system protein ParE